MFPFIALVFIFNTHHQFTGVRVVGTYKTLIQCDNAVNRKIPKYVRELKGHNKQYRTLWGVCLNSGNHS